MAYALKRINISSAFRIGVIVNALLYLIMGFLVGVVPLLLLGSVSQSMVVTNDPDLNGLIGFVGTAGAISFLCFYLIGVVFAAIFGGITFALGAWFYNLASRWVGGIEVVLQNNPAGFLDEIERDIADAQTKQKRSEL